MTSKQVTIGGLVALVLTAAVGLAVGQRQAKNQAQGSIIALQTETDALREKLQQTEADLAALVRTAKQPKIVTAPSAPAPAPSAPAATNDPGATDELKEKDQEIAALKEQLAQTGENRRQPPDRQDWQQRMEQMQRENPEEYQRIQQERRQRTQDMAQRTNDRYEFFAAIPTEGLSEEYLANHQALLERVQFFSDAMAQMAADPNSAANDEFRRGMRENMDGVREMVEMEREVLISDLLSGLGADAQQTTEAMDYMKYVNEMTSMGGFFGRGIGGGRGGRGR